MRKTVCLVSDVSGSAVALLTIPISQKEAFTLFYKYWSLVRNQSLFSKDYRSEITLIIAFIQVSFENEVCGVKWRNFYNRLLINKVLLRI